MRSKSISKRLLRIVASVLILFLPASLTLAANCPKNKSPYSSCDFSINKTVAVCNDYYDPDRNIQCTENLQPGYKVLEPMQKCTNGPACTLPPPPPPPCKGTVVSSCGSRSLPTNGFLKCNLFNDGRTQCKQKPNCSGICQCVQGSYCTP